MNGGFIGKIDISLPCLSTGGYQNSMKPSSKLVDNDTLIDGDDLTSKTLYHSAAMLFYQRVSS
jgi:hypothetical protein